MHCRWTGDREINIPMMRQDERANILLMLLMKIMLFLSSMGGQLEYSNHAMFLICMTGRRLNTPTQIKQ